MISSFIDEKKPFTWAKRGLVYGPGDERYSHASHPCIIHYKDDLYVVAFTRRDRAQRSHIFLSYAKINEQGITLLGEPKLALRPGAMGYFDCDGVISVCLVKHQEQIYLYYVGWQNLPDDMWICDTGRAILDADKLELKREFLGPVLARDKNNPLFAAATAFHVRGDLWQTWYNSGVKWEETDSGIKHHYGIHYANSLDGIDWNCKPGLCLPFKDEYEYAFGRPSVYVKNDRYYMWYAHRGTKDIKTYRIGFAISDNGQDWKRYDELAGIDVSNEGWDSEMICYPYVFEHGGKLHMLYNGNGYGKTGFGLAVLEE